MEPDKLQKLAQDLTPADLEQLARIITDRTKKEILHDVAITRARLLNEGVLVKTICPRCTGCARQGYSGWGCLSCDGRGYHILVVDTVDTVEIYEQLERYTLP